MQVGFIGTGSMGRILIEAFIESNALHPAQIHAANRTFSKVKELAQVYTGLHAYPTNIRVAQRADILFLCVKPLDFKDVLEDITPYLRPAQMVVSITSPVKICDLESHCCAKVAKIIPSITNSVQRGASLLIAGSRCTHEDQDRLYELMRYISQPVWIDEKVTRIASDIVSCGPAFFSYILQEFVAAATRVTELSNDQAAELTSAMVVGLGRLLAEEKFTLQTLQERVCVPGGVTGEGLKVLKDELSDTFERLFLRTQQKFEEDLLEVDRMFS